MNQADLPSSQRLRCASPNALSWLDNYFERAPDAWNFSAWSNREALPLANRETIESRMAEIAFWYATAQLKTPPQLPPWLLAVKPFADADECLNQLLPYANGAAMAVFPLAGCDGRNPKLARLYLLPCRLTRDSRSRLSFANAIPKEYSVLIVTPSEESSDKIAGDSWQLAAALAQVAANEPALRVRLGVDWACTGAVNSHGKVKPVELGNKAALATKTSRRWLLPDGDNIALWRTTAASNSDAFGVRSLTEAATYVREYGVVTHQFQFPQPVDELHVLLGGAITPALAVSMQIFPRRLCLWHSEKTRHDAEVMQKALGDLMKVELQAMPSDNLAAIEVRMRDRLEKQSALTRLVNFTGGNRIMGFGAMLAARHCRISLVYRDIDAPPDQLDMIDFADDPTMLPRHGKVIGNNCPDAWRQCVNWEMLYDSKTRLPKSEPPDTQAEVERLQQILWQEGHEPNDINTSRTME
ncbi:MAG TPA: hypothetical protein PLH67_08575 [Lentisphaeria bacterium]|nr:hypothetical protein [Lentisphaeria bacterium]